MTPGKALEALTLEVDAQRPGNILTKLFCVLEGTNNNIEMK